MVWHRGLTVLGTAVLMAISSGGAAQDPQDAGSPPGSRSELAEVLLAYHRASQPGPEYRWLKPLEGRWEVEVNWTGTDGVTHQVMGLSENRWILGGRFLRCEATASVEGIPVEALTFFGFNANHNRFSALELDNLGTDYLELLGTYDPVARSFILTGRERDELNGVRVTYRMRLQVEGPDRHTVELFLDLPVQGPVRMLEAKYTRL